MSHKDAAALFNVSTRWIRELLHRYREGGYQALQPRSRRPALQPQTGTREHSQNHPRNPTTP
ncbi:helix-turn-helix domain containing protein [Corynebacterium pseudodiphtheriticum]|nr:helix-turn-helix domain-containing protein [Corynebacterium pseudodiphtheriticum]WKS30968.1 helix-turn-helix domain containing protein [Corynebacterium pseudodiphtheriticum]